MTHTETTGTPQERIVFFDTTLRDGEQSPGCSMTTPEKIEMAHALDELGVDILEAGFAISSEGDFQAIRAVSQAVRRPVIASLARARELDVERAAHSLKGLTALFGFPKLADRFLAVEQSAAATDAGGVKEALAQLEAPANDAAQHLRGWLKNTRSRSGE